MYRGIFEVDWSLIHDSNINRSARLLTSETGKRAVAISVSQKVEMCRYDSLFDVDLQILRVGP